MQVSVESTSSLGRRLTINIPAEKIALEEERKVKELSGTVKVNGFRPGKVPYIEINRRFGPQVRQESISKILEASLTDALSQENLNPVGRPNIENIKDNKGQDLEYTVTFDVLPDIKLINFSEIQLEKPSINITDTDVAARVKKLQDEFASWNEINHRPADTGDKLILDFIGTIDGVAFDGGTGNGVPLELGSGQFIPGFEDALIGSKVSENRAIEVTFPDNYGKKDLIGKLANFSVLVKGIQEKTLAPVDAAFARKIGLEDGDTSRINEKVLQNMTRDMEKSIDNELREQALEKFLAAHIVEVPDTILQQEQKAIIEEMKRRDQGIDCSESTVLDQIKADATKRSTIGLLLNEVVKTNKIIPDQARVQDKIRELSTMFGDPDLMQRMQHESKELIKSIENTVLTDQAIDIIIKNSTIVNKS